MQALSGNIIGFRSNTRNPISYWNHEQQCNTSKSWFSSTSTVRCSQSNGQFRCTKNQSLLLNILGKPNQITINLYLEMFIRFNAPTIKMKFETHFWLYIYLFLFINYYYFYYYNYYSASSAVTKWCVWFICSSVFHWIECVCVCFYGGTKIILSVFSLFLRVKLYPFFLLVLVVFFLNLNKNISLTCEYVNSEVFLKSKTNIKLNN